MNKMIVISGGGTSESAVDEAEYNRCKGRLTPQVVKIWLSHPLHSSWEIGKGRERG